MSPNIPRTGRIGRFAKIIENHTEPTVLQRVMQDSHIYGSFSPVKKAEWWKSAVERLEKEIGQVEAIEIMQACGRRCCDQGNRATARRLMNEADSLKIFW